MTLRAAILCLALAACRSRAPAAAPDAGVDWAHVAEDFYLAGEEYLENQEIDGGLERRRPAIRELLDQAAELGRQDGEIDRAAVDLSRRLAAPVDYQFSGDCERLAARIAAQKHFPMTPAAKPSLEHGAQVYAAACAACHGRTGDGTPEVHVAMDPPPADLLHPERAWRPYDVFARVTYGGVESAMPAFGESLSASDRWDLVFWLFAARWPPCTSRDAPRLRASELALERDFDLSNKVPYDQIACVRRDFLPP